MNYAALKDLPPCTVVKWNTYVENPGVLYDLIESPDMIWNLTCKEDRSLKAETAEELQLIKEDVLHKPMLFQCCVAHSRNRWWESYYTVWSESYAVLINPQNPAIQEFLQPLLKEAINHANAGEKFCLKIKFGKCVKYWYGHYVEDGSVCAYRETALIGMGLRIYNYSLPIQICYNPRVICYLLPCWLLFGGSCYVVQRKIRFIDSREKLRGIPISLLNEEDSNIQ